MTGRRALLVGVLALTGLLAGCSGTPSDSELQGAADARPAGLAALEAFPLPELTGWTVAAERTIDACGSNTSDQMFDETHIEGYSCVAVRRTAYELTDAADAGTRDAAAFTALMQIQTAFADLPSAFHPDDVPPESPAFAVNASPPNAGGALLVDGRRVQMTGYLQSAEVADYDILPIWHINERVESDSGEMRDALMARADGGEFLVITVTLSYFSVQRDDA